MRKNCLAVSQVEFNFEKFEVGKHINVTLVDFYY